MFYNCKKSDKKKLLSSNNCTQKFLLKALEHLDNGSLTIITPEGEKLKFKGKKKGRTATLKLNSWNVLNRVISHGDIGFAEDYIAGLWESDDEISLLVLLLENYNELEKFFHGNPFCRIFFWFKDLFNRDTENGSRKNISAHYDLGNNFYQLWLDKSMTYSSALFNGNRNKTLEKAQQDKYKRILDKLGAKKSERILEVGCGWGGFAEVAAKNGVNVTCITISEEQAKFAKDRLKKAKLDGKAEVKLQDYRRVSKQYDYVVSIGMLEHVGEEYWLPYFKKINSSLKKGGRAMIQSIVIRDDLFSCYRRRSDFIRRYIFPGGMLPTKNIIRKTATEAGFDVKEIFSFGMDYAITLENWLERFDKNLDKIRKMGYSEEFIRKWRIYLLYCIAGFISGRTEVTQTELVKQ